MATFTDLPLAVVDHLLDICADALPGATLRSCALVCRYLRPLAQSRIFNVVKITTHLRANSLVRLIQGNPRLAGYINDLWLDMGPLVSEEYFIDQETASLLVSLNGLAYHPLKLTVSGWDDGDLRAIGWPREISPYSSAFSRIVSLDLLNLKHIPVRLFDRMPHIESLCLTNVTFYPGLDTLTTPVMESIFTSSFRSVKKLIIESMDIMYGIFIASCPDLEDLQLFHVKYLAPVEWYPGRILPAPKDIDIAFAHGNHGVVRTLMEVIDVQRLYSLTNLTAEARVDDNWDLEDAIRVKQEFDCIIQACNTPTGPLRKLFLDFIGYAYPTTLVEVGIDISTIPTVTFLAMNFFCLKPADDKDVPIHIRDIALTIPPKGKLETISITLTIALCEIMVRKDGTSVIDFTRSSQVSHSLMWPEIWGVFSVAFLGLPIGSEARSVDFRITPVRVASNGRGYEEIEVDEDELWRGIGGYIPRHGWEFPFVG